MNCGERPEAGCDAVVYLAGDPSAEPPVALVGVEEDRGVGAYGDVFLKACAHAFERKSRGRAKGGANTSVPEISQKKLSFDGVHDAALVNAQEGSAGGERPAVGARTVACDEGARRFQGNGFRVITASLALGGALTGSTPVLAPAASPENEPCVGRPGSPNASVAGADDELGVGFAGSGVDEVDAGFSGDREAPSVGGERVASYGVRVLREREDGRLRF